MDYKNILLIISGYIYLFIAIVVTIVRISLICVNSIISPELLIYYCLKVFTGFSGIIYGLIFITRLEYYFITPFIAVFMLDFITLAVMGIIQLKQRLTNIKNSKVKIHPERSFMKKKNYKKRGKHGIKKSRSMPNEINKAPLQYNQYYSQPNNYNTYSTDIMAQYIYDNIHKQPNAKIYPINRQQIIQNDNINSYKNITTPKNFNKKRKSKIKSKKNKKKKSVRDIFDSVGLDIFNEDSGEEEEENEDEGNDDEDGSEEGEEDEMSEEDVSDQENKFSSTIEFIREFM